MIGTRQELMSVCIRGLEYLPTYIHIYIHKPDGDLYISFYHKHQYIYIHPPKLRTAIPETEVKVAFRGHKGALYYVVVVVVVVSIDSPMNHLNN